VLDAGCGIGLCQSFFGLWELKWLAWDSSEEAICQAAWRVPSGRFTSISLSEIIYEQNFDIVFCIDVLYHIISDEAWKQALSSLCNCLYSGGLLIIIEQLKAEQETPASHVHFRTLPMYLFYNEN
jgi:2-polyprenyl-3-methyl-5-hydroxy-6-metoxy-1,4-benzoquinol methylase